MVDDDLVRKSSLLEFGTWKATARERRDLSTDLLFLSCNVGYNHSLFSNQNYEVSFR